MMKDETTIKSSGKQEMEEREKQEGRLEAYSEAIRELLEKKDREKQ
ncbi:MAG: hypothetical protein LUD18_03780 [Lachnospiraceae bacterium]|nr:hypothetical protein [Lachnospiraceae bacterium]